MGSGAAARWEEISWDEALDLVAERLAATIREHGANAVGVYLGYDKPRQIGNRATGGGLAAPIVKEFMKVALSEKPAVPFRVPNGVRFVRVDLASGALPSRHSEQIILEAFKPGTEPTRTAQAGDAIGVSQTGGSAGTVLDSGVDAPDDASLGGLY